MRCAAFFAFSTLSPASNTNSLSLALPSALMPPCRLMSSMARLAPLSIRSPWRAHGPDIGAMRPIFTSVCAEAGERIATPSATPAHIFHLVMTSSRHATANLFFDHFGRRSYTKPRAMRLQEVRAQVGNSPPAFHRSGGETGLVRRTVEETV